MEKHLSSGEVLPPMGPKMDLALKTKAVWKGNLGEDTGNIDVCLVYKCF